MNVVKHIAFSVFVFFALTNLLLGQGHSRHCTKEPVTSVTHWGGNEWIVIDLRDKPVRTVEGIVLGPGVGSLKTLVQVFRRKPSDPLPRRWDQEMGLPAAACMTGDDGVFTFSLPPGEYELRMSQNPGVDVTSVIVTVERGAHRSEEIKVEMQVGT